MIVEPFYALQIPFMLSICTAFPTIICRSWGFLGIYLAMTLWDCWNLSFVFGGIYGNGCVYLNGI